MQLSDVAARLDCVLKGEGGIEIRGVVGIDEAEPGHLTFVSNPKYAAKARTTKASAVIVSLDFPEIDHPTLRSGNPYLTFARAVELFYAGPIVNVRPLAPGRYEFFDDFHQEARGVLIVE